MHSTWTRYALMGALAALLALLGATANQAAAARPAPTPSSASNTAIAAPRANLIRIEFIAGPTSNTPAAPKFQAGYSFIRGRRRTEFP